MTAANSAEFLAMLGGLDIRLTAQHGDLRYSAPPGALTAELRAEIGRRKPEILTLLREAGASAAPTDSPITPVSRLGPLPLSFAQQRLWFLQQLDPQSSAYNLATGLQISGSLDTAALARALERAVERHEPLRTQLVNGDTPAQVICSEAGGLSRIDLSGIPVEVQARAWEEVLNAEARAPFRLDSKPLMRARLLCLTPQSHVLVLVLHHIIADGWSLSVLVRELIELYRAEVERRPADLQPLSIQYADYAAWQQRLLEGETLSAHTEYWRCKLAGAPALLDLPSDRPRPPAQSFRGAGESFCFSAALVRALEDLGRREGATLFMTLLAGLKALLMRYTGQLDIVVGAPIAGRNRPEMENLIGYFANTLVLRTLVPAGATFRELLAAVRQTCLEAYAYQELPFDRLVEELNPLRRLSYNPLFQVLLGFQNTLPAPLAVPGLEIELVTPHRRSSRFDLAIDLKAGPDGIAGIVESNADLFEPGSIRRMIRHFENILTAAAADPASLVLDLPMLSAHERHALERWNSTSRDLGWPVCVHRLVERNASGRPAAAAVVSDTEEITYATLNRRANRLAHRLIEFGVGPEVRVGVCLERSADLICALLAVLKAGGAYVPLDPSYPAERLAFQASDSGAAVVITESHLEPRLGAAGGVRLLLDRERDRFERLSADNPRRDIDPSSLAYVIYTSGSTGHPKGVMIEHGSLFNLLAGVSPQFDFGPADVWTVVHAYSFDFSVWEIWACLASGGTLVLVPPGVRQLPDEMADLVERRRVTVLNQTPSAFRQLLPLLKRCAGLHLRLAICGGEGFPAELVEQLNGWTIPVWNFYGPTEATVWAANHPVTGRPTASGFVPIGKPLPNYQLHVVDGALAPVACNIIGEIAISGIGLARGYWNRPDLTAACFVPDPGASEPGARLYRTGDLGRRRSDGTVEFLQRLDHQVKVRGYRIELGEIEAALLRLPEIAEVAMAALPDPDGGRHLVAYLVARDGQRPAEEVICQRLRQVLPEYMVPSRLVWLDRLPLTPNGKLDRAALPASTSAASPRADAAPRNSIERTLASIWADELQIEQVGIHDDFFAIGGHSLLASRVISRARAAFQTDIPVRVVFEKPTVARMATEIVARQAEGADETVIQQRLAELEQQPESAAQLLASSNGASG